MTPQSKAAHDICQGDVISYCGLAYTVTRVEPAWHAPGSVALVVVGPSSFPVTARFARRLTFQLADAVHLAGEAHAFLQAPR